jgi:hypothetical protein
LTALPCWCRSRAIAFFYGDPPQRKASTVGRPRRTASRFDCKQAATWPAPDRQLVSAGGQHGKVVVQAWSGLHPKLNTRSHWAGLDEPPIVRGTVIRVQVERLPGPAGRALKTLWLWWSGPDQPDLDLCWRAYIRRFDIEHTIRFSNNTLGWTTPSYASSRAGRPLDYGQPGRLDPAAAGPARRCRPPHALGTTP